MCQTAKCPWITYRRHAVDDGQVKPPPIGAMDLDVRATAPPCRFTRAVRSRRSQISTASGTSPKKSSPPLLQVSAWRALDHVGVGVGASARWRRRLWSRWSASRLLMFVEHLLWMTYRPVARRTEVRVRTAARPRVCRHLREMGYRFSHQRSHIGVELGQLGHTSCCGRLPPCVGLFGTRQRLRCALLIDAKGRVA